VTLLVAPKSTPDERLYVPAFRKTTWLAGQDEIALLICTAVAPGLSVAQIVVRVGIPPETPALDQSIARDGSRMPDQGWAWATIGALMIRSPTSQAAREWGRVASAFPNESVCN